MLFLAYKSEWINYTRHFVRIGHCQTNWPSSFLCHHIWMIFFILFCWNRFVTASSAYFGWKIEELHRHTLCSEIERHILARSHNVGPYFTISIHCIGLPAGRPHIVWPIRLCTPNYVIQFRLWPINYFIILAEMSFHIFALYFLFTYEFYNINVFWWAVAVCDGRICHVSEWAMHRNDFSSTHEDIVRLCDGVSSEGERERERETERWVSGKGQWFCHIPKRT